MTTENAPIPFSRRHIGPGAADVEAMLERLGVASLDELVAATVPASIRLERELSLGYGCDEGLSERRALQRLQELASSNRVLKSYIGQGFYGCVTPPVIQRNVLENPGWYTAYTPYQAELAQGRLEALLNFQTLVSDLTGLPIANASLLDEATAAAEAMALCRAATRSGRSTFLVAEDCHPQNLEVLRTRAEPLGIRIVELPPEAIAAAEDEVWSDAFGVLLQSPGTTGRIPDMPPVVERAQQAGALVAVCADPLSLLLLRSPGELGADVAVGSLQRFGMPMGYGGPHAGFIATREAHKRLLPGRVVGVSKDSTGRPALRLALQTREQHIRRAKATSNICTAQVLPAVVASMYAVYHGPAGLRAIAEGVHRRAVELAAGLQKLGYELENDSFFDTLSVLCDSREGEVRLVQHARDGGVNLRSFGDGRVGIALDETVDDEDLRELLALFAELHSSAPPALDSLDAESPLRGQLRDDEILTDPVWRSHRSETEMLRYLHRLESRDLALNVSMIPLGSCTMKLNATAEMMPITWPGFAHIHPFAPGDQARGYARLFRELEDWLSEITGFAGISLQPNAGSQGEYAGLLVIRRYHRSRGDEQRDVCLIPTSAHGTNPASAVMAGMRVVAVRCDDDGNIDLDDLAARAEEHRERLAALMVTYPSTHGVFEEEIREICDLVHEHGGQVYMDGANMNAQVGLCRPADFGADVCHLNLHKTFCIPHGGGGPGMGPIGVVEHLRRFLPAHETAGIGDEHSLGAVSSAPFGSGAILPISWAYIALMGGRGLRRATEVAILNANYVARRLEDHYPVLYRGREGFVAHECILDLRPLKAEAGVEVEDVAKRLIDFGFHAPTMSWPVAGTVMVEPTESESKAELDRFCDAMIAIRAEARAIADGEVALAESALRNAPHTAKALVADDWPHPYSRRHAAYPAPWLGEHKYWPPVARVDNAWGDRNLICTCAGMEELEREVAGADAEPVVAEPLAASDG